MARPLKQGLDYFPLDTDFLQDIKVRRLIRACGSSAIPMLIGLLVNIYRGDGYYLRWDSDMTFLISDEVGISEGAAQEFINKAVQVGFFDKKLYEEKSILTSAGIQRRFFEITERRKSVFYDDTLLLIDVNEYTNLVNVNNNSVNVYHNQQSKVKESRVEESKVKEKKIYSPSLPSVAEDIVTFLNSTVGSNYKSTTDKTRKLIAARLAEGFTIDDFQAVISKKAKEWQGTDMAQYLRPETLFGTKFEGYLNQPEVRNNRRSPLSRAEQERQEGIEVVNRLMREYEEEGRANEQARDIEGGSTATVSF